MVKLIDQIGNTVILDKQPQRIISLVPSITETLFDLGLNKEIVGRTKFCIHPQSDVSSVAVIGGTKNLQIDKIKALIPDLIIANKEENEKEQVDDLMQTIPVYTSDVSTYVNALDMIEQLGLMTNRETKSNEIMSDIGTLFSALKPQDINACPRVLYLIWKGPYMSVGGDTFIHNMLSKAGFYNILHDSIRYPTVNLDEIASECDQIFLSSEPYPFKNKDKVELEEKYGIPVKLVDGEMFSWYGSRMIKAGEYFNALLQQ